MAEKKQGVMWGWSDAIRIEWLGRPQKCSVCVGRETTVVAIGGSMGVTEYPFCLDRDSCCRLACHRVSIGMDGRKEQGDDLRSAILGLLESDEEDAADEEPLDNVLTLETGEEVPMEDPRAACG